MDNQHEYSIDMRPATPANAASETVSMVVAGAPTVSFIIDPRNIPTTPQRPSISLQSSGKKDASQNSVGQAGMVSHTVRPTLNFDFNTQCGDSTNDTSFGGTSVNSLLDGVNDAINKFFDEPQTPDKLFTFNDPLFFPSVPGAATENSLINYNYISTVGTHVNPDDLYGAYIPLKTVTSPVNESEGKIEEDNVTPRDTIVDLGEAIDVDALVNTNENCESKYNNERLVTVIERGRRRLVNKSSPQTIPKELVCDSSVSRTRPMRTSDGDIEPSRRRVPNNAIFKQSIKGGSSDRSVQCSDTVTPRESTCGTGTVQYQLAVDLSKSGDGRISVGNNKPFAHPEAAAPTTRRRVIKRSDGVITIVDNYQSPTVENSSNLHESQQFHVVQSDTEPEQVRTCSLHDTNPLNEFTSPITSKGRTMSESLAVPIRSSRRPSNISGHHIPSSPVYSVSVNTARTFPNCYANGSHTPGAALGATRSLIMSPDTVRQSSPETNMSQDEYGNHCGNHIARVLSEERLSSPVSLFGKPFCSGAPKSLIVSPNANRFQQSMNPFPKRMPNGTYYTRHHQRCSPPSMPLYGTSNDTNHGSPWNHIDPQTDEYDYMKENHSFVDYKNVKHHQNLTNPGSYHPSSEGGLSSEPTLQMSPSQDTYIISSPETAKLNYTVKKSKQKLYVQFSPLGTAAATSPNSFYYTMLLEFKNKRIIRCRAEVDLIHKIVDVGYMNGEDGNPISPNRTSEEILPGVVGSYFVFRPDKSIVEDHEDVGLCVGIFSTEEVQHIPRFLGMKDTSTVIRIANEEDCRRIDEELPKLEERAMESCHNMIHFLHLPIICVDAEYTFDKKVVIIYYSVPSPESKITIGDCRNSRLQRELSYTLQTKVVLDQLRDISQDLHIDQQFRRINDIVRVTAPSSLESMSPTEMELDDGISHGRSVYSELSEAPHRPLLRGLDQNTESPDVNNAMTNILKPNSLNSSPGDALDTYKLHGAGRVSIPYLRHKLNRLPFMDYKISTPPPGKMWSGA